MSDSPNQSFNEVLYDTFLDLYEEASIKIVNLEVKILRHQKYNNQKDSTVSMRLLIRQKNQSQKQRDACAKSLGQLSGGTCDGSHCAHCQISELSSKDIIETHTLFCKKCRDELE